MVDISYVIYDGSKDPVCTNSLIIYDNHLKYDDAEVRGPIDALLDFGNLLVIRFDDHVYRFAKHSGRIFGGRCSGSFVYGIMYYDEYYRWFDVSEKGMALYVCSYNTRSINASEIVASLPADPLTAVSQYLRTINHEVNSAEIVYGKDLLKRHNARGIKRCNHYSDILFVTIMRSQ